MIFKPGKFLIIAGPCAIESLSQLRQTALAIKDKIDILRGGAYKPRTDPESFQGLGKRALEILRQVGDEISRPVVTEVLDTRAVGEVARYADIIQIGARNMQNFELLKEVAKTRKTVLLKRGFGATVEEWLKASAYLSSASKEIILCERGIRTFEGSTRFTLDLAGALVAGRESGYPVIIDPSHATGDKELVSPLAKAAKAAGLDGVMIEVHHDPSSAGCDGKQSLTPKEFKQVAQELKITTR